MTINEDLLYRLVSERIRSARTKLKLSQAQLAENLRAQPGFGGQYRSRPSTPAVACAVAYCRGAGDRGRAANPKPG